MLPREGEHVLLAPVRHVQWKIAAHAKQIAMAAANIQGKHRHPQLEPAVAIVLQQLVTGVTQVRGSRS